MAKAYFITRCVLDNPVKHHQTEHNNSSLFHMLLIYLMKTTITFLKISSLCMQNQVIYDMLGKKFYSNWQTKTSCYVSIHLRSHINHSIRVRVFSIVFSCLDIPVKHSLSLFIYNIITLI